MSSSSGSPEPTLAPATPSPPGALPRDDSAQEFAGFRLPQRTKMLILGAAGLALLIATMEGTIIATAIPRIVSNLGSFELIAWVTTTYILTSVTVIPISGRLSDVYGRKPLLLLGLVVFLIGSMLSGFAQDMTQLIIFRGVQGFGAGVLMTNTIAVTGDLYPANERGKYLGIFAAIFGVSAVVGPSLGGILTDELSWRWVFWIHVPLGVVTVFVIARFMPSLRPKRRRVQIDYLGALALIWALVPGLLALAFIGSGDGWTDPHNLALFAASAVGLFVLIGVERVAPEPAIPLELLRNPTFAVLALGSFAIGLGVTGVSFFVPVFVQGVVGRTATESGTIVTPQMLGLVVAAALAGQFVSRTGRYKWTAVAGASVIFVALVLLTQLDAKSGLVDVLWRTVIFGLGMGLLMLVIQIAMQNAAPQRLLGAATSSQQFFSQVGGLIGVTVFGTLLNTRLATLLGERLPEDLVELANPQRFLDPAQREALQAELGADTFEQVSTVLREALAIAITDNYWIAAGVAALVVVAMLVAKELRLQTAQDAEPRPQPSDGAATEISAAAVVSPPAPRPQPRPRAGRPPAPSPVTASAGPADWLEHAWEWRLPPIPPTLTQGRTQVAGVIVVGAALGLAMAIGVRGQRASPRPDRRRPQIGDTPWRARLGLADWLDPPPPRKKRRWF